MSKKQNTNSSPLVYSTDPNYLPPVEQNELETLDNQEQPLRIILETKQRAGKTVTIVLGFVGNEADMNTLGKAFKSGAIAFTFLMASSPSVVPFQSKS